MEKEACAHPREAGRAPADAAGAPATWGQLLRRYRQLARLSQEELAERSGYSTDYISKLERDQRQPPPPTIEHLATVLGLGHPERDMLRVGRAPQPALPGSTPLAGRGQEVAQLVRQLAGQGPPALLLAGEPGIGKTRLLQEAAARAAAGGWRVVQGGCQRRAQDPYAPLNEALARSLQGLVEPARTAALSGAAWLGLLLPELAGAGGADVPAARASGGGSWSASPPEQQRRLLGMGVARYLRGVAGSAGTLLVLDDLQWAGADALDLLAALITSAEAPPLRLIAAYRDSEVSPGAPLSGLIADLARDSLIRILPLGPLPTADAVRLLADLLSDGDERQQALLPAIARRAGGVPFFLVSYAENLRLRDLRAAEAASTTPTPEALELPWTVTQVIRQRALALPGAAQELLGLAALIGRVVPRALLTRVSGVDEEEMLAALEAATAARLLDEEETGYRFAHDVIKETIEQDLSVGRRRFLHRRIGAALEDDRPADVDALVYHFVRSDDGEKALEYLELAGDEAQRRYAHAAAIGFYQDAVARLDQRDRAVEAASLRERLAVALFLSAHYDEAIAVLERARAVYRDTRDDEGVRRISGRIAEAAFRRGGEHDPLDHVAALADESDAQGRLSPGSLRLRQGLFRLLFARNAYTQMLAGGHALARLGHATRRRRLEAMGAAAQGVALIFLSRLSEGVPLLEDAMPTLLAAGQRQEVAEITLVLHGAHLAMGSVQHCRALSEQMLPIAQSLNDPVIIACHCAALATTLFVLGDWETGRTYLRRADALLAPVAPSSLAVRAITLRVAPRIWEGDWEQARRSLQTALHVARAADVVASQRQALIHLAELDLLDGDPRAAVARLAPLADAALEWSDAVPLLATLAWACLETGEVARAEHLVQRAIVQAERLGTWFQGVSALRIQGLIAAQLDRYAAAAAAFDEGLRRARAMPFPYGEALLLQAYGQLERQLGDPAAADMRLAAALTIFRRLGAHTDIARTEQMLGARG